MSDLSITETESRYFGDLFLCCDVEKTGKIPALKATELFRSANLSNDVIRQITLLSGISQTALHITRAQFYSCLKLIAAHQAAVPLRAELLTSSINLPLPRFSWKLDSPPLRRSSATGLSSASSGPSSLPVTSGAPCGSASETNGLVSAHSTKSKAVGAGESTRQWREVRCSPDLIELARLKQQQTPQEESEQAANSDLHSTDSEVEHNDSESGRHQRRGGGQSPEAWSTNSDSPTPTNSVAERAWVKDSIWQGLLNDEHRQLLGTEEESSDRHSSEEDNDTDLESVYQITSEQREYYNKQFRAVQPDPNGLLSGHIARIFFEKSRIPVEELRHIWQLCDVTRDGALSLAEFTAAMHLVVLRRNNIPLPAVLPPCLNPTNLQQSQQPPADPPEADLLHLGDDDTKPDDVATVPTQIPSENDYKRMISVHADKNIMNLSTISNSSQVSVSSKHNKTSSSPRAGNGGNNKNRSVSNSPPQQPPAPPAEPSSPSQVKKSKELIIDWYNKSKEWTKFTESPTSNVSSPGPKPVNFDMQRTAQAVVSDPQILHPVPLRVTPVGAEIAATSTTTANNDDDVPRQASRKSDILVYDGVAVPSRETSDTSPKQLTSIQHGGTQIQHRDSLPGSDLRAIQRPQPKKLPTKNIGAIPPPPQREPSIGGGSGDALEDSSNSNNSTAAGPPSLLAKKEPPPLPPPRPHRHARSSSLDLNKFKMSGNHAQTEIIQQNSFDVQVDGTGFADFTQFPDSSKMTTSVGPQSFSHVEANIPPPPRPTISSLQTSQRASAFEVYRKPNTPRNSQSPESLQLLQQNAQYLTGNGADYERRIAAISETLRHVSFKSEKNIADVLKHLKEQNTLLLRLCTDLSEELQSVQQRKEEARSKLDSCNSTGGSSGNISTNVTGGSGSSIIVVHSNV